MSKREAGRLGGLATLATYGRDHFQAIGRKGGIALHEKYDLKPVSLSGWALVDRETNIIKAYWGVHHKEMRDGGPKWNS
ncbi:MAG: hypothetical protein ACYTFW_05185 [Planctomycetota bacterium]|jgi:general stress protein YciG